MATIIDSAAVNSGRVLQLWFEIEPVFSPVQIGAGTDLPAVEDDKNLTRHTTTSTGEEASLYTPISYALGEGPVSFTFTSDNPTKIAIDSAGIVATQVVPEETATATITVTATQGNLSTIRAVSVTLTVSGSTVIDVIEGGVDGSARKALTDILDSALSGADPVTQQAVYTSQDHAGATYVRNSSFFLSSHVQALTCASPWNSSGGNKKAGTAITERHAVLNSHYRFGVGTTLRFVTSDNSVIERTVVQARGIFTDVTSPDTDVWMVLLDSDLPASITPCKLFPSDYELYLPAGSYATSYAATSIPLIALDQEEKGIVVDVFNNYTTSSGKLRASWMTPTEPDRIAFNEPIVGGDSSNPVFAAIGSELWLMSSFWWPNFGPFYGGLVSELNAMIVTLDTLQGDLRGYTVT